MLLSLLFLLGIAAPAAAQTTTEPAAARTSPDNAPLLPGDVIRIFVWREVDFQGDFTVQEDLTVALPRVGIYSVAGKGRDVIERELLEEYSRHLLQPAVDITVLRRIAITGEVREPGLFPVDPTLSLTDVLILAGGPLPTAREDKVVLIRNGEEMWYSVQDATVMRNLHLQSGDQIYVPKQNWFMRNWKLYAGMLSTVLSLSAYFLSRK